MATVSNRVRETIFLPPVRIDGVAVCDGVAERDGLAGFAHADAGSNLLSDFGVRGVQAGVHRREGVSAWQGSSFDAGRSACREGGACKLAWIGAGGGGGLGGMLESSDRGLCCCPILGRLKAESSVAMDSLAGPRFIESIGMSLPILGED